MTEQIIDLQAEEREALARIARTRDGFLFHRYLRRVLEAVWDDAPDGALRAHNGRRSLARDLMREMAEGIEGSTGDGSGPGTAGGAILTRPRKPAAVGAGGKRDVRSYIARHDPELPEFNRPAEPGAHDD